MSVWPEPLYGGGGGVYSGGKLKKFEIKKLEKLKIYSFFLKI